jgi:hypothetical protein
MRCHRREVRLVRWRGLLWRHECCQAAGRRYASGSRKDRRRTGERGLWFYAYPSTARVHRPRTSTDTVIRRRWRLGPRSPRALWDNSSSASATATPSFATTRNLDTLLTTVPLLNGSTWRLPNSYPTAGVRRGTATSSPTRSGTTSGSPAPHRSREQARTTR